MTLWKKMGEEGKNLRQWGETENRESENRRQERAVHANVYPHRIPCVIRLRLLHSDSSLS